MKAGWKVKALGDVCEFVGGSQPPKSTFSYEEKADFIRLIQIRDYKTDEKKVYIPTSLARRFCSKNDIMIGRYGPPIFQILRGIEGAYNVALMKAVPDETVVYREYFYHFLKTPQLLDYVIHVSSRAAGQAGVNKAALEPYKIPLPPLEEQKQIVAVLDAAFEGLTRARTHVKTNLQNARELFRRSIESRFEALVDQGELKTVDDIAQIKGGKRLPKGEVLSSEKTPFPYISIKDFNERGSVDVQKIKYLSASAREAIKNYIINTEDLYISIAGTIGKTGIVPSDLNGANLTENAARMVFVKGVSNEYVYYFTLTDNFQEQAGLNTRTAAQPKLALKRLKTISIPMVRSAEQLRVTEVFKRISEQTEIAEAHYRSKLQDLDDLRQSLLQKAFAGELT